MSGVYPSATVIYKGEGNVTVETLNDDLFALHIPALVFVAVCMVAGIVGNLFVIAIYKTKFRRSNHRYFILFLAVIDLLASCVAMPFVMASLRLPYLTTSDAVCKTNRAVLYYLNNVSGLMVVVISVERFRKICRPFKKQLTHRHTLYICFGVVTFSAIMASPSAVLYAANLVPAGIDNITCYQCSISPQATPIFRVYLVVLMLETTASICVFAVLYSFIIRTLWKNDQFLASIRKKKPLSAASKTTKSGSYHIDRVADHEEMGEDDDDSIENIKESYDSSTNDSETTSGLDTNSGAQNDKATEIIVSNAVDDIFKSSHKTTKEEPGYFTKRHTFEASTNTKLDIDNRPGKRVVSDPSLDNMNCTKPSVVGHAFSRGPNNAICRSIARRQTTGGRRSGRHSRSTTRVTLMLLTVSIFFAAAYIPHLVLIYIVSSDSGFLDSLSGSQLIVFQVFLRSFFINNVVNPFIYLVFDSKFRKISKEAFRSFRAKF